MDKADWQSIKDLFYQASELAPNQQEAFVRAECQGDEAIYMQVISMLEQSDLTRQLGSPVPQLAQSLLWNDEALIGQRLGNYRLVSLLGKGGMGAVYLAERADEQFIRKVAIKVIRSSVLSEQVKQAFFAERQILANLEHASIGRLLDGGTNDDGLPYLVMEYIEGVAIDEYCNTHKLNLEQRLTLFRKVCDAVQYAHQKLIVHCDLKPSNILITAKGEPKLLDFGISKLLSQSDIQPIAEDEINSERRISLQYSSPEQIRAEAISTLSDVYSLGVILYQLISSERPYNITTSDSAAMQASIANITIVPPSNLAKQQAGSHQRRGDLDNITLLALQQTPQDRYDSVAQFSNDIGRCLSHFPVLATPTSWFYRSTKFLRRNRLSSGLTSILIVAILGSSLAIWQQSVRVAYERDLAIQSSARANAISNFLTNMFTEIDPYHGNSQDVLVKDVLKKASEQLNANEGHALTKQPLVAATLHRVIGQVYNEIGMLDLAEKHLSRARTMYRDNNATGTREYLGGLFMLSLVYSSQFEHQKNLSIMTEAYELSKKLYGEDHRDTLGGLDNLGMLYMDSGKLDKAKGILEHVYQRRNTLFGEDHRHTLYSVEQLGKLNLLMGDYAKSESLYRRCLAKRREIYAEKHPYILRCQKGLGLILLAQHKYAEAKTIIEQHIQQASVVLGDHHPDVLASKHNLAGVYLGLGQLDLAEQLYRQTLALRRSTLGNNHVETLQSQMKLAQVLRLQQGFEEAKLSI